MSIHTDGYMPGPWKFFRSLTGGFFLQGAVGNPSGSFEIILATEEIRPADAVLIENVHGLMEALEEIKRNCEPWRKADNMAGRLCEIAEAAIARAKNPRTIGHYNGGVSGEQEACDRIQSKEGL